MTDDKSVSLSALSGGYCLVDYDTLSVFADLPSEELIKFSTFHNRVTGLKPFKYRVSDNSYRDCLILHSAVVGAFIGSAATRRLPWNLSSFELKMLKFFHAFRKRHIQILIGTAPLDIIVFPASKMQLEYSSVKLFAIQGSHAFHTSIQLDKEVLEEYDGLKSLLMKRKLKERLEQNPAQIASNLILHLREYWNKHLTREQALKLIDEDILVKFDNTPNDEKYNFIKEIGKKYFAM